MRVIFVLIDLMSYWAPQALNMIALKLRLTTLPASLGTKSMEENFKILGIFGVILFNKRKYFKIKLKL